MLQKGTCGKVEFWKYSIAERLKRYLDIEVLVWMAYSTGYRMLSRRFADIHCLLTVATHINVLLTHDCFSFVLNRPTKLVDEQPPKKFLRRKYVNLGGCLIK